MPAAFFFPESVSVRLSGLCVSGFHSQVSSPSVGISAFFRPLLLT